MNLARAHTDGDVECGSDASSAAAFHRRSVELRPWVGAAKGRQLDAAAMESGS
jgi:hypothetical protein